MNREYQMKIVVSVILLLLSASTLIADPLVIKGADGSWLPVLAREWHEKSDGVLISFETKEKSKIVRNTLLNSFPEIDIERHGKALFFPQTSLYSLFNRLSSIDFKVVAQRIDTLEILKKGWDSPLLRNQDANRITTSMILGRILATSIDAKTGIVSLTVRITKRTKEGDWKKIRGTKKLQINFAMKNGVADPNNSQNRAKADVLFAKKDDIIAFLPASKDKKSGIITVKSLYSTPKK